MDLRKKKIFSKLYDNMYDDNSCVLELTLHDFTYKQKKRNKTLCVHHPYMKDIPGMIIFYAPWCKSCQSFSDEIIEIAYSKQNTFHIASVNVENIEHGNDILSSYAKIKYYPTLKMVQPDGSLTDYKGSKNIDNILYYINSIIDT
jgi:thiol-disulfide isomerase/thioredoxin